MLLKCINFEAKQPNKAEQWNQNNINIDSNNNNNSKKNILKRNNNIAKNKDKDPYEHMMTRCMKKQFVTLSEMSPHLYA